MSETSEAEWVVSRISRRDAWTVATFMPEGFEAYARVLHPAGDRFVDDAAPGHDDPARRGMRWSEVAEGLGTTFRPDAQFGEIAGGGDVYVHPALGDIQPMSGSLPRRLLITLVSFLHRWTRPDEPSWFAMWDGNGTWWKGSHGGAHADPYDDERDAVLKSAAVVEAPFRRYFLMRGPLDSVIPLFRAAGHHSPALWWPQGHEWLVSTEVDAYSTYVGGSDRMVGDLLASTEIEAVPITLDAPYDWGM
jgi:hypothetical protein